MFRFSNIELNFESVEGSMNFMRAEPKSINVS